jgi:ribosome maturation factor RimP
MQVAYEKLNGIDRDRLHAVLEPVLLAHGVEAIELTWQTDDKGWLLSLTIEKPGHSWPGEGVTVDLCADISRDLSVSLDVMGIMPHKYRLEVGSPGLERSLYRVEDYARFAGCNVRLKLREPILGQSVLRTKLCGLDTEGKIIIETENGQRALAPELIQTGRLVFDWNKPGFHSGKRTDKARSRNSGRNIHISGPQRSK